MAPLEKLQSEPDRGAVLNLRHTGMELLGESQVIWGSRLGWGQRAGVAGGGKKRRDPEAALHQGSLPGDREEIGGRQVALVWLQ